MTPLPYRDAMETSTLEHTSAGSPEHPATDDPTPLLIEAHQGINTAQLGDLICQGAANLTAAECEWLLAVAEFDRREAWHEYAMVSCAAWLAWQVNLDMRAAREKVRVAQALARFPTVRQQMSLGRLCYTKVRAITRVATEANERELVSMALYATSNQVERIVAAMRRATAADDDSDRSALRRRSLSYVVTDDQEMVITLRCLPADGAAFLAAAERFMPDLDTDDPASNRDAARRADGAILMAHAAAAAAEGDGTAPKPLVSLVVELDSVLDEFTDTTQPDRQPSPDPAHTHRTVDTRDDRTDHCECSRVADRVGSAGFANDEAGPNPLDDCCGDGWADDPLAAGFRDAVSHLRLDGAATMDSTNRALRDPLVVSRRTVLRSLCDCEVEAVVTKDGEAVGISTRSKPVTGRQRRLVLQRDEHRCRFPGCGRRGWLQVHHIQHRARQGDNQLQNLLSVCWYHHRAVHEGGWSVRRDANGRPEFVGPTGRVLTADRATHHGHTAPVTAHGRDATDGRSAWAGDSLDLALAVEILLWHDTQAGADHRAKFGARAGDITWTPAFGHFWN